MHEAIGSVSIAASLVFRHVDGQRLTSERVVKGCCPAYLTLSVQHTLTTHLSPRMTTMPEQYVLKELSDTPRVTMYQCEWPSRIEYADGKACRLPAPYVLMPALTRVKSAAPRFLCVLHHVGMPEDDYNT